LRIEIGPKDLAKGSVVLARRDKPGKEGKSFQPQQGLPAVVSGLLDEIQAALLARARNFRDAHTKEPKNYEEFKAAVETGFALAFWCGSEECEAKIKEETKATVRCIPLSQPESSGACILCGKPSKEKGIFGHAY
jgi:prolyl-tRNA synthetase